MSVDSDPDRTPEPANAPVQMREKLPVPQAKRRFKRDGEEAVAGSPEDTPVGRRATPGSGEVTRLSPEEELRNEISSLHARLESLVERREANRPPEPEARSAKYFRLTRKASAPAPPRESGPTAAEPAAPVVLSTSAPRGAGLYRPQESSGWVLASAVVLALVIGAFVLGWWTNRPVHGFANRGPAVVAPWSEPEIVQLDHTLGAVRGGNLFQARTEARELDKQLGGRPQLAELIALLSGRIGSSNDAEASLVRRSNDAVQPREVAAVQSRLGFIYSRRRDFPSAIACFAGAAANDPLDPVPFYNWGEALRRTGRLPDAIGRFREALLRLPDGSPETESLRQCAALRLRLCQIEDGNDGDVKSAIDLQLAGPAPSIYWLLTGVAYDLQHGDVTGASGLLAKLHVAKPQAVVDVLLDDYFLRALGSRNAQVASYFPELTVARRKQLEATEIPFIDP
jgi:tetratricopeptide (TPR) repeat protein